MSNQLVGTVFDRVIQEVCDASQVDFEESGVDQQTLLDLRKNQILPPTATVPSNAPRPPQPSPTQHVPPQPLPQSVPASVPPLQVPAPVGPSASNGMGQSPQIKTEPGVNGHSGLPPMNSMMMSAPPNPQSARERAANLVHQRYGAAAANSVSQMQAQPQPGLGMPRPPNMQPMPNGQGHPIKQEPGYPPLSHPSVGNSQTDGASGDALSEWKAEVTRRREAAEQQDGEGDRALREHLRQRILQFEGGGLMLPLEEQQSSSSRGLTSNLSSAESKVPRAQFDGPGGDDTKDEDDEDAINSDLDDPDDLVAEDHDAEDAVGQVMLCTYDKVQRVKNKWKCTLKDGILTTGGKEYVFHKGQGEFEW
ncbi:hypothetical protein P175DRAFT_0153523 [Aspergillus ochraceoroseus IBT 24754]|uniref:Uncharacterized protein n=1 Tax=Aspergillus ochraceoroseus IBT 24754 TaxID=1392256 RepID=A0A2T5M378_9EURO|nr:uncharacterized protein P175DRAFT_0153523 [Aspergillus ochraceoroseus IBT 24754]PTU22987.1 hypothetical protein P175DRAFT_0153523 [Aspergillus ochraceoroseus IBT 24754]